MIASSGQNQVQTERMLSHFIEVQDLRKQIRANFLFYLPNRKVAFLCGECAASDYNSLNNCIYRINACSANAFEEKKILAKLIGVELYAKYSKWDGYGPYQFPDQLAIPTVLAEKIQKVASDKYALKIGNPEASLNEDKPFTVGAEFAQFASNNNIKMAIIIEH